MELYYISINPQSLRRYMTGDLRRQEYLLHLRIRITPLQRDTFTSLAGCCNRNLIFISLK